MTDKPWYASWFDTPFYHTLYAKRDEGEAKAILKSLLTYTGLVPPAHILDLACGKGRFSFAMNQLGYKVTGLDLSSNNIEWARKCHSAKGITFVQGDMRQPFGDEAFDAVFNLFTSFGYFETDAEHLQAIESIHRALMPGGWVLFDFMNAEKVAQNLVECEEIVRDGIHFAIYRKVENGYIVKDIEVDSPQGQYKFQERVRALSPSDFKSWFERAGLTWVEILDVNSLRPFDPQNSDRMLVVGKK